MSAAEARTSEEGERITHATPAAALAYLDALPRGTLFYVHVNLDAPCIGDEGKHFPGAIRASLKVTRADAVKIVRDGFSERIAERGAGLQTVRRIWPGVDKYSRTAGDFVKGKPRTVVWLG